jgi:TPR repeat protein
VIVFLSIPISISVVVLVVIIVLSKIRVKKGAERYKILFDDTKQAAEKGDVEMMYRLSFFYENGIAVKQNFQEAFNWYEKANNKANGF